ncbi:MAG: SDR family oxidoreductase, partial [Desulfuromonas thiophila]|nr:SDR family oxidoreductase [Desulfuromonas thiophila]
MGLLTGKKALILGVANEKSIAWAIARLFHAEGAELMLTYAGEAVEKRVRPLAESLDATVAPCNVTSDDEIAAVMADIKERWGGLDILIHSVAFADREELKGSILSTTRQGFATALDVSAYSLIALL